MQAAWLFPLVGRLRGLGFGSQPCGSGRLDMGKSFSRTFSVMPDHGQGSSLCRSKRLAEWPVATLEPWGKGAERSKRVLHYCPGPRAGGQTGPSPTGRTCARLAPPMQKPLLSVLPRSDVTVTSTSASRCICLFPLTVGSSSWGCQRAKCPWVGSLNTGHVLSQRWRLEGAASPLDPLLGLHLAAFSPCPNFLWRVHS